LRIKGEIQIEKVKILPDTGSDINLIHKKYLKGKELGKEITATQIDSTKVRDLFEVKNIEFYIQNKTKEIKTATHPNLDKEAILGNNWMRKNVTSIDYTNKCIWMKKESNNVTKIPFWSEEAKTNIVRTVSELNK
jgi:hypothetical protein